MAIREIIRIDEDKCDGCGLCVPACAEGAIRIIDGKARLISEVYCDGMGACLGECPQDAITIERREADRFDEKAVAQHLARQKEKSAAITKPQVPPACPGSLSQSLQMATGPAVMTAPAAGASLQSLSNWPIQLMLAPTRAPYFDRADLVIAADCVPFAFADFNRTILNGGTLLIACPKLDNVDIYRRKFTEIFEGNDIKTITIAFMEVPCCSGLVRLVQQSLEESGKTLPLSLIKLGIRGEIIGKKAVEPVK